MLDLVKITSQKVTSPEPDALGIHVEKPKFPEFALVSKRLESYQNWPENIPTDKKDLTEAGLVYTGVGDSVRCYFCGGGLKNWEPGDVPMEEHARWYPKCPHVILVKGQAYVDRINRGEEPEETDIGKDQGYFDTNNSIKTVAAQSCIEMGYSKEMVKQAVKIFMSKNEPLETLLEENHRLKENQMCKICLDSRADVIFLPCGHMVSCPQCAQALLKCPVCRQTVNGQLKAFFPVVKTTT
ncbi:baculoviral IAP repeat-containing protein 7-A-like isoform X2 [Mercenaria mercenaria]|uniref:baculoviral IAP repeat-containing protein 7-A-like isoform X2 n=1 Tax=Mercenaria mercenaria TaxID=6596 RepID=UPI00234FB0DC|nr:baculoviral IAP repeat-containing protein 7-A-like isoform X2 [Mercenaria mercenaria]